MRQLSRRDQRRRRLRVVGSQGREEQPRQQHRNQPSRTFSKSFVTQQSSRHLCTRIGHEHPCRFPAAGMSETTRSAAATGGTTSSPCACVCDRYKGLRTSRMYPWNRIRQGSNSFAADTRRLSRYGGRCFWGRTYPHGLQWTELYRHGKACSWRKAVTSQLLCTAYE